MSNTARLAHYVVPDLMGLETPAVSQFTEASKYYGLWTQGFEWPYAMYAPAVVDPPGGSDLIENWQFRSEEHTSELQSREKIVCRLLLEKKEMVSPMTPTS